MDTDRTIKEITYKGHTITKFVDKWGQELVIIDNKENSMYASIADAKRYINNKPLNYIVK